MLAAFAQRRHWPAGMQRYMASLYALDVDTWRAVADLIERAAAVAPPAA